MSSPTPKMDTASDTVASRFGAYIIDRILLFVGLMIVLTPVVFVLLATPGLGDLGTDPAVLVGGPLLSILGASYVAPLFLPLVQFFYTAVMEARGGQTYGKRGSGIVVVTTDGNSIGAKEAIIRAISWFFEGFFFGIPALVAILATEDSQRIGDILAGTVVVEVEN